MLRASIYALLCVVWVSLVAERESLAADLARPGVCMAEGTRIVGTTPVRIDAHLKQPKKIKHVAPKYPVLPPGTTASGVWRGEYLIDRDGTVVEVWTIQELRFRPAFPPFNQAIVDAIRQWQYEPPRGSSGPTAICSSLTTRITWS